MTLTVRQSNINQNTCYLVSASEYDCRVRLFMQYGGLLSYSGEKGSGLFVSNKNCLYDDWSSGFRLPRIDAHKYNTEIIVPLDGDETVIEFLSDVDSSSESYVDAAVNPVNILVERHVCDYNICRILVEPGNVYLELDTDELVDGTSVTISNPSITENHLLGPDGLRICGTYNLYKVSGTVYRYATQHYKNVTGQIEIDPTGYTASVWEACYYDCGQLTLKKVTEESAVFDYADTGISYSAPLTVGDKVSIGGSMCRVIDVNGSIVRVGAVLSEPLVRARVMYTPRTPSRMVPVNWPVVSSGRKGGSTGGTEVDNGSDYDQSVNTEKVSPLIDTYFASNERNKNHNSEDVLICKGGDDETVACIRFAPNAIRSNPEAAAAELTMYVKRMHYSEVELILYQMDAAGWGTMMMYDEIMRHVTNIPVGSLILNNPGLRDVNELTPGEIPDDSYGQLVSIPIDQSILEEWLSGSATYTPSIAIKVVGLGNPYVEFASTSDPDVSHRPYIIVSGGEPSPEDLFSIKLSDQTVEPGQVVRITPESPEDYNFGKSIYSNVVMFDNTAAAVVSGSPTYLDVTVPEGVSGNVNVVVYRTVRGDERVPITDNDAYIYVDVDPASRNVKLAKKIKPGVVNPARVSRTALYNRDMGFAHITEVTDETSLIQNVYSILLTNPGERLFNQHFGTGIEQRLFKIGSREEGITLLQECIQKVHQYEPRVYIDGEQSLCEFDNSENLYYLLLCCVLPSTRTEMIRLPFKNRGKVV